MLTVRAQDGASRRFGLGEVPGALRRMRHIVRSVVPVALLLSLGRGALALALALGLGALDVHQLFDVLQTSAEVVNVFARALP